MKAMTVRQLIDALSNMSPHMPVHTDEDDYPCVTEVQVGSDYKGPAEYTPPADCVLLTIDFPK